MKNQATAAWAVEYVENGKRILSLDPNKHTTPEDAKRAFEDLMGIPWKELERRGAKVVELETPMMPTVPPSS